MEGFSDQGEKASVEGGSQSASFGWVIGLKVSRYSAVAGRVGREWSGMGGEAGSAQGALEAWRARGIGAGLGRVGHGSSVARDISYCM